MRNRILIGMGTSLLDGAGRVRPGSTLGTIEALSEQANAQTLHDHPDTAPSQLLALNTNLLPSVFWDKDQTSLKLPNPDGTTSFFVNLAEPDAMSQVVQLLHEGAGEAAIERELTAGKSGLVDQAWSQAAAIQGSAGEAADFKSQSYGARVLHFNNSGVLDTRATTLAANEQFWRMWA